MDQSAVDVMPDRVILRATGDFSRPDACRFSSACASDFEHHDVLENILDPNLRLTPGMTLCGTAPSKEHHSKEKQPRVQLICLGLNLDPVTELVELFHEAIEGVHIEGPVLQITDGFALLGKNHPRVLVVGSRAQERLQAQDPRLASILTDVITTCPDMTCVLSDGTITKASELSLLVADDPPKAVRPHPENRPNNEPIADRLSEESDTSANDPEPSF